MPYPHISKLKIKKVKKSKKKWFYYTYLAI